MSGTLSAQTLEQLYGPVFNPDVTATKEGKSIIITGKSCDLLKAEAKAIARWGGKNSSGPSCSCSPKCKIDVTTLVPDFARESQGVCPIQSGPNCWNSTLVSAKITGTLRYSKEEEMTFWMTSPLCKEKSVHEPLAPGDIVAIRSKGEEVHSFINLSDNLSFSKNGSSKKNCFSLQSPDFVYRVYEVPDNCRRVRGKNNSCPYYANIFTCEPLESYLRKNPIKHVETRDTWKELNEIECQFAVLLKDEKGVKNLMTILNLTKASLKAIEKLAEQNINSSKFSKEDKFIWKGIYVKARSLIHQIEYPKFLNNGKPPSF